MSELKNVLKKEYWNRADAFLLPLTGLKKQDKFDVRSFLFWKDCTIHDYKLTISYDNSDPEALERFCTKNVFPILDRGGYLVESHDINDRTLFVADLSDWAPDVELFIRGKYSKLSVAAREIIERYHTAPVMPLHVYCVMYPNKPLKMLGGLSPIEYICQPDTYGLRYEDVMQIGEIGTLFEEAIESLVL